MHPIMGVGVLVRIPAGNDPDTGDWEQRLECSSLLQGLNVCVSRGRGGFSGRRGDGVGVKCLGQKIWPQIEEGTPRERRVQDPHHCKRGHQAVVPSLLV